MILPPKVLDETLRPFATELQWKYYETWTQSSGIRPAAEELGISRAALQDQLKKLTAKAKAGGWAAEPVLETFAVSELTGPDGELKATWDKRRRPGMHPDDADELPDPKVLTKLSTFTNGQGEVIAQWRSEKPELIAQAALWEQFAETLIARTPTREEIAPPIGWSHQDLLACYPVGDQHHGMAAWAHEAGANWDMKISDQMIRKASHHLIGQCPPCETAVILFLGDFFHYDSYKPLTPAHAHLLDADGRMPKMVDTGWLIVEHLINAALEKHQNVHVIWEAGNHDEALAPVTRGMLRRLYRDNPRVTIDGSDAFWHYYQFGKVMLVTNHGDKIKPAQQLGVAAHDQSVMWGETTRRDVFLGHRHHEETKEYPGGWVHTMPVLPPPDAYAHRGGYRNAQSQHALVYHREGRLQTRHLWYPDTVEAK